MRPKGSWSQELTIEGVGDTGGGRSAQLSGPLSWDWPAFKTCDLSGDTCTLNPSDKEKASCWLLCNVIYFLTLQMFIEHF